MQTQNNHQKDDLINRRRRQILDVAREIFARNGYRRTKISQIADTLGVGKGTLYRYFENKKSLLLAVYNDGLQRLGQAFETNVYPIQNPREKLSKAVRTYFSFFDKNRDLIEIMMQVRSEFKDDYRKIYLEVYRGYIVKVQENLRHGIEMGLFRQLDVEKTAEAVSAILQGVLQSFYVRELTPDENTYGDDAKHFENAAYKEPSPNAPSLSDRTEPVNTLLLEGLLKRNDAS